MDYTATLFRSIPLKPCRDRRPRLSEKKKRLLCVWLHTNSRLKSKICCFSGRRGRRPLQAKNQTASIRRYGAKTLSFPDRRGRRPLQAKIQIASTRRYGAKILSFPGRRKAIAVAPTSKQGIFVERIAVCSAWGTQKKKIRPPVTMTSGRSILPANRWEAL